MKIGEVIEKNTACHKFPNNETADHKDTYNRGGHKDTQARSRCKLHTLDSIVKSKRMTAILTLPV
jgi:hypothetical protein